MMGDHGHDESVDHHHGDEGEQDQHDGDDDVRGTECALRRLQAGRHAAESRLPLHVFQALRGNWSPLG